jgi:hypothetical protein
MLAINLDSNGFLHLRPYKPNVLKSWDDRLNEFITQAEQPRAYRIFKSKSLTNAFLAKYKLEMLKYKMLQGYTMVLTNFYGFSDEDLIELRQYRYKYVEVLRQSHFTNHLPDLRNCQPDKVLVYDGLVTISLKPWIKSQQQARLEKVLKEFSRVIVFKNSNTVYFKKSMHTPIALWKAQFLRAGYCIEHFELDGTLSKLALTPC